MSAVGPRTLGDLARDFTAVRKLVAEHGPVTLTRNRQEIGTLRAADVDVAVPDSHRLFVSTVRSRRAWIAGELAAGRRVTLLCNGRRCLDLVPASPTRRGGSMVINRGEQRMPTGRDLPPLAVEEWANDPKNARTWAPTGVWVRVLGTRDGLLDGAPCLVEWELWGFGYELRAPLPGVYRPMLHARAVALVPEFERPFEFRGEAWEWIERREPCVSVACAVCAESREAGWTTLVRMLERQSGLHVTPSLLRLADPPARLRGRLVPAFWTPDNHASGGGAP